MVKRSCNPFKMWGSWGIGATGLIVGALSSVGKCASISYPAYHDFSIYSNPELMRLMCLNTNLYLLITAILGFLIGWGINSLIRKIRKN